MTFLLKYNRLFGIIRILLGILFIIYPFSQYLDAMKNESSTSSSWMFALLFFILYAISALANGLREIQGKQPAFSLLRFFEVTLNSFVTIYIIIIILAVHLNPVTVFLFTLLDTVIAISALRDMRYISIQYYEKKETLKNKKRGK